MAHADSNKGFLQSLCGQKVSPGELDFDGKSLAKIIHQPHLLGFQCNSDKNRERILSNLKNKDYNRINPLAVLKCSDCHGIVLDGNYKGNSGSHIGSLYTEIKLSEKSFVALKMALIDSTMRICDNILGEYPFIEGVAINSNIFSDNNSYSYFHFNKELNCIIGSRGTGKSTLLEVIQSIISPNSLNQSTKNKAFDKYYEAVVYLNNCNHVYALYCKPKFEVDSYTGDKRYIHTSKFYYKSPTNKRFAKLTKLNEVEFLQLILTAGYQQQQLFEYSINPNKILDIVDDFINWKHHKEFQSLTKQIKYQHEQLNDLLKNIRKNRKELNKSFIEYIIDSGDINTIVNIINIINNRNQELSKSRFEMINELNRVLTGKVKLKLGKKLSVDNWRKEISELATAVKQHRRKYHDYYVKINRNLQKIYKVSILGEKLEFNILLLNSQFDEIIELYKLTEIGVDELTSIRNVIDENILQIFLQDSLKLEYNINTGSHYSEKFMDNQKISMGQNAVALLLLILNASYALNDNRPLLMDQPEDDLDNSYIYSTLVKEFRNSKKKRQVIISTHNPNIPVAADAESIMVLKYNGTHSYLDSSGSIDSSVTAKAVLETMEGGKEAIQRRMDKYNIINLN